MPLKIIRNDITRVKADAIVNTANPAVAIGAGVDLAIYEAAGKEQLLAERAKIGPMKPGEAAATEAFALDAKYIIHTVGPAWMGGGYGEREAVACCYKESLRIASELGCESIAFPLISTGTYGFPKDEALNIAVREISSFLFTHDMTVYMVVYDKESFVISGKAFADIRTYIEEKDVKVRKMYSAAGNVPPERRWPDRVPMASYKVAGGSLGLDGAFPDKHEDEPTMDFEDEPTMDFEDEPTMDLGDEPTMDLGDEPTMDFEDEPTMDFGDDFLPQSSQSMKIDENVSASYSLSPFEVGDLDDIRKIDDRLKEVETFQEMLFRHIDRKGLEETEVYKKANLSRKLFSKIRSNKYYVPSKKTVLALAIALELNMDETIDLLMRAGLALSPSSRFDLIVGYCIEHKIYNIFDINTYLFEYDEQLLVG